MLAELTIYAADSILTARLLLVQDRVSELLNTAVPIDLRHVRITSLDDGRRVALDALEVDRNEILMAVADTIRGRASRRVATVQRPVIAVVGPYRIVGRVHGPPSTDPIELARRKAWVVITNATVTFRAKGQAASETHGAVIVHARHMGSLVADDVGYDDGAVLAAPASAGPGPDPAPPGPRARDAWPTDHPTSETWRQG